MSSFGDFCDNLSYFKERLQSSTISGQIKSIEAVRTLFGGSFVEVFFGFVKLFISLINETNKNIWIVCNLFCWIRVYGTRVQLHTQKESHVQTSQETYVKNTRQLRQLSKRILIGIAETILREIFENVCQRNYFGWRSWDLRPYQWGQCISKPGKFLHFPKNVAHNNFQSNTS